MTYESYAKITSIACSVGGGEVRVTACESEAGTTPPHRGPPSANGGCCEQAGNWHNHNTRLVSVVLCYSSLSAVMLYDIFHHDTYVASTDSSLRIGAAERSGFAFYVAAHAAGIKQVKHVREVLPVASSSSYRPDRPKVELAQTPKPHGLNMAKPCSLSITTYPNSRNQRLGPRKPTTRTP